MVSLVSNQAKYDRVKMGKEQFNKIESHGYELFKQHCNRCHQEPLFRSDQFERNTSNLLTNRYNDNGRFRVSRDSADWNKFKVPSLRNLKYSYPYMHDGRYISLKSVLNYYSDSSGMLSRTLTPEDKTEILAFLQTLNDSSFVFNRRFQFPSSLKSQMP
jgi:cytochrome c peroxidase